MLTKSDLDKYLGKTIKDICDGTTTAAGYDTFNHCAHFVGHVLGLGYGYTCKAQWGGNGQGACVRVHEIFGRCVEVGPWSARPLTANPCLAFVTKAAGMKVKSKEMANIPNKHIGIFLDGTVWHYSNTKDKVVTQTPDQFSTHYAGAGYAMYFGRYL